MSKVFVELSMSLDGFVAGPNDSPENPMGDGGMRLFQWYYSGDTAFPLPGTDMVFKISRASAELLQETWPTIGAMVVGRRMFDIAGAWGGNPPGGGNCFVVTHTVPQEWVKDGSPFTFVTDGVESAIRQAKKVVGDKNVAVSSANIAQQCIKAGLVDEIHIDLVPVLLGGGVRLFDHLGTEPIELERVRVVAAPDVTHLIYRVVKQRDEQESDLPIGLAKPAQRALASAGYRRLEELTEVSQAEIRQLHGIGAKALDQLRRALDAKGLSFADGKSRTG